VTGDDGETDSAADPEDSHEDGDGSDDLRDAA